MNLRRPKTEMPPYTLSFANRQRVMRVDRRRLARLARSVLAREQVARAEVSVALVDDRQIQIVNREFLSHDSPTDVISFLLNGDAGAHNRAKAPRLLEAGRGLVGRTRRRGNIASRVARRGAGKSLDGEIVISAETACLVAGDYGTTPAAELALYLVHGLLHLCGYDDASPSEKRLMRRREAEALHDWNVSARGRRSRSPGKK